MCRIEDRFTINPDLMWKRLGSQIITLNLKTHQYHVLNEAAALIFEHSTGNNTVKTVAQKFTESSKVTKEQGLEDTRETIDGMVKLGLIVGRESKKEGYSRPAIRQITEDDFKKSIASGAELACRSLLGA